VIVHLSEAVARRLRSGHRRRPELARWAGSRASSSSFEQRLRQIGPRRFRTLGSVQRVLNAVFVEADAAVPRPPSPPTRLGRAGGPGGQLRARPVRDRAVHRCIRCAGHRRGRQRNHGRRARLAVSTTRTALSAAPAQLEAYEAAYGTDTSDPRNTTRDGLFPTAKVDRRIRLRGRVVAERTAPTRPRPDRLRGPRHPRGRHHRWVRTAWPPGASLYLPSRCAPPCRRRATASRCCREWSTRSTRTCDGDISKDRRRHQHVARLQLRPGRRRPLHGRRGGHGPRHPDGGLGRQLVRQALHRGYAVGHAVGAVGGPDPGALGWAPAPRDGVAPEAGARGLPAVVHPAGRRDQRAAAVRQRCGRKPARVRPVPGRLPRRQGRPGQPWWLQLHAEDQEHR
jgi:hypothetical protein